MDIKLLNPMLIKLSEQQQEIEPLGYMVITTIKLDQLY